MISCHVKVLFLLGVWQEMFVFPRGVSCPGPRPEHLCHFESRIVTFICVLPTHPHGYSGTTLAVPSIHVALAASPCWWEHSPDKSSRRRGHLLQRCHLHAEPRKLWGEQGCLQHPHKVARVRDGAVGCPPCGPSSSPPGSALRQLPWVKCSLLGRQKALFCGHTEQMRLIND